MLRRILLSAVVVLVTAGLAYGQEKTVTGTVTDADSAFPLPGVNIAVKGTMTGTATGIDGTYSIRVSPGAVLVYSFVGYLPQEVTVGDQNVINIALAEDVALLSEVVVVGYGTQRKADVTGAVSNVKVSEANVGLVQSPEQLIQGRVSGVRIIQNDGDPGAGVTIRVRGGTSISASNDPLYVIDGVPIDNSSSQPGTFSIEGGDENNGPRNPLSFLNPSDIESIDILKDASAAAIYGSRGANGVILITTKKGRSGQLTVNYSGRVASSSLRKKLDLLSASEYRQFVSDFGLNNDLGGSNTDWQDEVFQSATSHEHNLSFSGGTESTSYRASVGYRDQEGIVINSGQERVTSNLSATHNALDDKLKLAVNLNGSFVNDNLTPTTETNGFESTLLGNVIKFNPTLPVDDTDDGCLFDVGSGFCEVGTSVRNPVAIAEQVQDLAKTTRILGNITADYSFTNELSGKVNVGLDRSSGVRRTFIPKTSPLPPGVSENGTAAQNSLDRGSRLVEVTGQYNSILDDRHSINVLGGYSWQDFTSESFGVETRDFVTDAVSFNNLNLGANFQKPVSDKQVSKLISFFGRVNYGYDSKYLLTATIRRDGSSRFGADEKWGVFPSASVAWRLSRENFLANVDWLDDLKIRVGWGITGSQEIGNLLSQPTFAPSNDFIAIIGENEVVGVAPNNVPNASLKWEETTATNVGLDFAFWNGRVDGSLEWYTKSTTDLLTAVPNAQPAAVEVSIINAGEMKNTGFELTLNSVAIDRGDLTLNVGATLASNKNEIRDLAGREEIATGRVSGAGLSGINAQILTPGEPFGTFKGAVFRGFCGEEVAMSDQSCSGLSEGAQAFELDTEGNRVLGIIGDAQPSLEYGLSANLTYKDFDFSLFLRGVSGAELFNNTALEYTAKNLVNTNINFLSDAASDPTPLAEAPVFSSRWIQDASFLRAENITLGYTFNNVTSLNSVFGTISRARIYVTAQNLFVLTSYDGWDPEVNTAAAASIGNIPITAIGIDYLNYPRPRTFTFGIDLTF